MSLIDGCLLKYTPPNKGKVTIGGRVYPTVKIGNQWWMAENLDETVGILGGDEYYYSNNESKYGWNGYKCGRLYSYKSAITLLNNKLSDWGISSEGWRLPTKSDFQNLVGISVNRLPICAIPNSVTSGFPNDAWAGTNALGFNALPAGQYTSGFYNIGDRTLFWSQTPDGSNFYMLAMEYRWNGAFINSTSTDNWVSIRLVKDST